MLHILEVKWKRNQNADMIYKDFLSILRELCQSHALQRGERTGRRVFPDEIFIIRRLPEGFRRKWKKNVIFWITRAAGCTMNIRTATCCIILAGRSWMMSARRQVWEAMSDGLLEDLVQVLLFHEISRRRCRRRRCRGWY